MSKTQVQMSTISTIVNNRATQKKNDQLFGKNLKNKMLTTQLNT